MAATQSQARRRRTADPTPVAHLSVADRVAKGRAARKMVPRRSHAGFHPAPTAPTRSRCSSGRPRRGSPSSCRSATGACSCRRSPSSAARRWSMASDLSSTPNSRPARPALRRCPSVELRLVRDARAQPGVRHQRLRRDRPPARGSGTSSAWRRASRSPPATTGSPTPSGATRSLATASRAYRIAMARFRRHAATSTSGTRSFDVDTRIAEYDAAASQGAASSHQQVVREGAHAATACRPSKSSRTSSTASRRSPRVPR